jgi:hypothetical protein
LASPTAVASTAAAPNIMPTTTQRQSREQSATNRDGRGPDPAREAKAPDKIANKLIVVLAKIWY